MDWRKLLKELDCNFITGYTEDLVGLYIPSANVIYFADWLSDIERENIILHEMGHLINHDIMIQLSAPQRHMAQEAKANRFMIRCRCEEWIEAYDHKPDYIDVSRFLSYFKLSNQFYDMAEQEFYNLLTV